MAWTNIPNTDIDQDSPVTQPLMTALRDNIIEAWRVIDFQEFLTSGTWTKPSVAQSGDRVLVQVVAGGGGGETDNAGTATQLGGQGGAGVIREFQDVDDLGASETVVVGAGGAGQTGIGTGSSGGNSSFGTSGNFPYILCQGGSGGGTSDDTDRIYFISSSGEYVSLPDNDFIYSAGDGANVVNTSGAAFQSQSGAQLSMFAGCGGKHAGTTGGVGEDGYFPGGGGSAGQNTGNAGSGADGVVRVWVLRF